MDVLRPQMIWIGNRCYRKNPSLQRDVNAEEEQEFNEPLEPSVDCGWDDEICDVHTPIEETDTGYQLKLSVASGFFKHIIGRKGETRRRLENETRTQIRIPKAGVEGDIVIVGHERKGIISAKTRIDVIVDSARQREPFTHFLSIPVTSKKVVDRFLEFKTDVLRECDGDRGIDQTIFQKPEKLHLTIGTLVLMSDTEVQKAVDCLQECHDDLVVPILKETPLKPRVQGLEYMNDDPNEVDVLYARIQEGEAYDRLQMLVDRVVDKFSSTGLMQREFDRVKLHITVMNTLMRKDPTGSSESHQGDRRGHKPRESFDAVNVFKKFKYYDFGEHHFSTVHLSQKHGIGKDGYYGCAGSLLLP